MRERASFSPAAGLRQGFEKWRLVIAAGVLSVGGAVAAGVIRPPATGTMEFELRKSLIQFLLIVALGAVVAFQVDGAKRRIEIAARKRQYEVDGLRSIISRLDTYFRAVKRERRFLRLVRDGESAYEACSAAMMQLDETKQDIETLAKEMDYFQSSTPTEIAIIQELVKGMESYLKPLEEEWKIAVATPPHNFSIERLHDIRNFKYESSKAESTFGAGFHEPYTRARETLLATLASKLA